MKRSREEPLLREPTLFNLGSEAMILRCPIDNQSITYTFPATSDKPILTKSILAAINRFSVDSDEPNSTKRLKDTEVREKTHDDDKVKAIDAVVKTPLKITFRLNPKSEPQPKPKRKSNPRPKPTEQSAPEPLSLPFFDSSISPEEIKAILDSKLDNMKSGLFSALNKIDESFACEVAANIEFDHVKCDIDPFTMKKTLEASDVGHLSRLMLKKEWLKNHILPFWGAEQEALIDSDSGLRVKIYDQDDQTVHTLTLKRWGSNTCYIFNNNWIESFVTRRNLKKGDEIGLYWDSFYSHFCFSVLN